MEHPEALIGELLETPPENSDLIGVAEELLAMLGRDEELLRLAESISPLTIHDENMRGMHFHFHAYALCRLGHVERAKTLWKLAEQLLTMALNDGSLAICENLKQFVFSQRGPDSSRLQVLSYLRQKNIIPCEPHRLFLNGEWTLPKPKHFTLLKYKLL